MSYYIGTVFYIVLTNLLYLSNQQAEVRLWGCLVLLFGGSGERIIIHQHVISKSGLSCHFRAYQPDKETIGPEPLFLANNRYCIYILIADKSSHNIAPKCISKLPILSLRLVSIPPFIIHF